MTDKRILEARLRQQKEETLNILSADFLPRFAFRHLSLDSQLLFLTGIRGVGKTTLALNALSQQGKTFSYVDISAIGTLKADEPSMNALLEVLYIVYGEFEWLLLDEFLCNDDWDNIIRYFRTVGIKVFAVASGVLPNKGSLSSYKSTTLYPLSFSEYCIWHNVNPEMDSPMALAALRQAFDDYSMRGGMPSNQNKIRIKGTSKKLLDNILCQDLHGDFRKSNLASIQDIGYYLTANSPVNVFYKEIAEKFGLRSENTAKKYLEIIKGSACVYPLERFSFQDKIRTYCERAFAADPCFCSSSDSDEQRLKSIIYMQLRRFCERHGYQVNYYGNRDLECDFVLCHEMKMRTIIQVIYDYSDSEAVKEKVVSLISLSSATGCGKLFILTDNCHDTIQAKGLSIYVKPAYEFLLDRSHMII